MFTLLTLIPFKDGQFKMFAYIYSNSTPWEAKIAVNYKQFVPGGK